jgi:hypothetical protein
MQRIPAGTHDAARRALAPRRFQSRLAVRDGLPVSAVAPPNLGCQVPSSNTGVRDCSAPPNPSPRTGDPVHSAGSANPDIRDACCRSTARKMRSLEGSVQAFQHDQTHRIHGAVHSRRVDAVAIVNRKSLPLIARHKRAELLYGPCCRRVLGRIPVHDPARADVQNDEDVSRASRKSFRAYRWPRRTCSVAA